MPPTFSSSHPPPPRPSGPTRLPACLAVAFHLAPTQLVSLDAIARRPLSSKRGGGHDHSPTSRPVPPAALDSRPVLLLLLLPSLARSHLSYWTSALCTGALPPRQRRCASYWWWWWWWSSSPTTTTRPIPKSQFTHPPAFPPFFFLSLLSVVLLPSVPFVFPRFRCAYSWNASGPIARCLGGPVCDPVQSRTPPPHFFNDPFNQPEGNGLASAWERLPCRPLCRLLLMILFVHFSLSRSNKNHDSSA